MTRTAKRWNDRNRRSELTAAEERRIREDREDREIKEMCARDCGLEFVSVAVGPQFDAYGGFRGDGILDVERSKTDMHGRGTITRTHFNPRAYDRNTMAPGYYAFPISTPSA